jgi:hypothetical protein
VITLALLHALSGLNPWHWSSHTLEVLIAVGTVGAVIVAVLGGLLRRLLGWVYDLFARPRLKLVFDPKTDLAIETVRVVRDGSEERFPAAFMRLRISNSSGARAADGVEVLLAEVEPLTPSPNIDPAGWRPEVIRSYGALGWTHTTQPDLTIGPGATRLVDLGYVVDHPEDISFHMALQVQPESGVQNLAPGHYRIRLSVVARNVKHRRWVFEVSYDGVWISGSPVSDHFEVSEPKKG